LFETVAGGPDDFFARALERLYRGERDGTTLRLLASGN
jgi:hypothetical protein